MIKHIKANNYKGITSLHLKNLGQTNIICGKNSSGKSSVLESLITDKFYSFGNELNSEALQSSFTSRSGANRFSTPSPHISQKWFNDCLSKYITSRDSSIVFYNEINKIVDFFLNDLKVSLRIGNDTFDLKGVFEHQFESTKTQYKPVLIPPKRQFVTTTAINLNQEIVPNGEGVINKLFFLKNHDLKTKEFIVFENVRKAFLNITNCSFNIIPQTNNSLKLQFKVEDKWIDADDCGLGLRDLLFLITFILSTDYSMYLIEEPENHLHADFQKKLLHFIREQTSKQFIISTHSNVFLDTAQIDKIFYCWFDKNVNVSDKTSMSKIIDDLGYSITENLTADAIIFTEGPTDIPIIKRVLHLTEAVAELNVKFWPLGGDIMASLDLSLFENFKNIFAIIDTDPGSSKNRNTFKKNCKDKGITCFQLNRYSIENYIPLNVIKLVFPNQIPVSVTTLVHEKSVDEQIGFKTKDKTIKGKNHIMAQHIHKEDIENTDLWGFANQIVNKAKEILAPNT